MSGRAGLGGTSTDTSATHDDNSPRDPYPLPSQSIRQPPNISASDVETAERGLLTIFLSIFVVLMFAIVGAMMAVR